MKKRVMTYLVWTAAVLSFLAACAEGWFYYADYVHLQPFQLLLIAQNAIKTFLFSPSIGADKVLATLTGTISAAERAAGYAYLVAVFLAPLCTGCALWSAFERQLRRAFHFLAVKQEEIVIFGYNEQVQCLLSHETSKQARKAPGSRPRICVISDAELALYAAHGESDGLLIIAGTGSIGYRKSGSTLYRAGGWGHLLGDEGSAWAIARAAICAVLQATDRGLPAPEPLWHAIAAQLQIGTPQALLSYVYSHPKADVAALCQAVTQCADGGDQLALRILHQAGEALANLAQELVSRAPCQEQLPLAISGSVLRHCTHVRAALARAASEKNLPLSHIISADEPTRGVLSAFASLS